MDIEDQDARELPELLSSPVWLPNYWDDTLVSHSFSMESQNYFHLGRTLCCCTSGVKCMISDVTSNDVVAYCDK
jgi:hypothetical protein